MFSIIKKTANVWHHTNDTQTVHLSSFGVVADITAQTFILRALNGAFFPRQTVSITDIQVIDETDSGTIETFANIDELLARLIQLQYPPYKTSGGGGGAVDSVNGQTGIVVLDADDISDSSTTNKFVTASEKNTWNNKEDAITAGTTGQYYAWDKTFRDLNIAAVSGLQTALSNIAETTTDGTVSSGTANTVTLSVLIPAGTVSAGNVLDAVGIIRATGTTAARAARLYVNSTPDLSGSPILIGALVGIVNNIFEAPIQRFLRVKVQNGTGAGTEVMSTSTNIASSYGISSNAVTTCAINWANDQYLVMAVQATNASDSIRGTMLKLRR